ncbi:MAG: pentapeptide repeat-containing protein [Nostoc sp.]
MRITVEELLQRYAAGERDFIGVDLRDAELRGINLSRANLSGAMTVTG